MFEKYFHMGIFVIPVVCLIRKYGSQTTAFFSAFQCFSGYREFLCYLCLLKSDSNIFLNVDEKVDIVVTNLVLLGNEIGHYLAYKHNASLALYTTWQSSIYSMHWALGTPHNPAYIPSLNSIYQ